MFAIFLNIQVLKPVSPFTKWILEVNFKCQLRRILESKERRVEFHISIWLFLFCLTFYGTSQYPPHLHTTIIECTAYTFSLVHFCYNSLYIPIPNEQINLSIQVHRLTQATQKERLTTKIKSLFRLIKFVKFNFKFRHSTEAHSHYHIHRYSVH